MNLTIERDEAHARLRDAGLELIEVLFGTVELWRTATGIEVLLSPALDHTHCYDEMQVDEAVAIATTGS